MTILPVYNLTLLPDAITYLRTDAFKNSSGHEPSEGEKVLLLPSRNDRSKGGLQSDDFYDLAVTGQVRQPESNGFVGIKLLSRMSVSDLEVLPDSKLRLSITAFPEDDDLPDEEDRARLAKLKAELIEFSDKQEWAPMARHLYSLCDNLSSVACILSPFMHLEAEERFGLLRENSKRVRAEKIESIIYEWLESAKLTGEGSEKREEDYRRVYRESAIKKQMAYLQEQLDEMHPENLTELRKLEIKLESTPLNETAEKEARKVLQRLKSENDSTQEYSMLYDYLDFLLNLPWEKEEAKTIALDEARAVLDSEHYGLEKIKERIIQQIAVLNLKKSQSGSILCFVGAPGTGKTSIGKSIAEALGRKYVRVSLGGVRDEADIRGHRRTYIGSMPGRIIDGISKAGVSNPVMVLDEVDKLAASYNGDPAAALLEVLDPEQNNSFTDHYLNVPFDLSDVLFICTANSLDTVPEPLLNRMEVIRFRGYTETEKMSIAFRHLLPRAEESAGIGRGNLHISDETMHEIIADYTMEAGVRGLKRMLDTLCRTAAVRIVSENISELTVEHEQLRDYLDKKPVRHTVIGQLGQPGVVTGLAWTQAGGDVLYIETLLTKGNGKLTITGQLGDVMRESVQIAVSLVKALYPDKADLFETTDLHIHVPDGAVPKDGPSAGITLTTALASLVTGKAVDPKTAMTGEVSLRGVVSPIGGLPEKLMAAKRAGVTDVLIPAENVEDLDEVAEEIKSSLNIHPVKNVEDALGHAGLK